jgi:hypothetical protein
MGAYKERERSLGLLRGSRPCERPSSLHIIIGQDPGFLGRFSKNFINQKKCPPETQNQGGVAKFTTAERRLHTTQRCDRLEVVRQSSLYTLQYLQE